MIVTFVGRDQRVGRQVAGVTYYPGDEAELSLADARYVIALGFAKEAAERIAVPEIEHRDTFGKKRKR